MRQAAHTDRDVAILIDATMDETDLKTARRVVNRLLRAGDAKWRFALVLSGEHQECKRSPYGSATRAQEPLPPFDVRIEPFESVSRDLSGWLSRNLVYVRNRYMDGALECGLQAAGDLDWRRDVPCHLFIMGVSLPHHDSDSGLLLRTGVECPKGVGWRAQLLRLRQMKVNLRAALPLPTEEWGPRFRHSFLGLMQRNVWEDLDERRLPETVDTGLGDRWVGELA